MGFQIESRMTLDVLTPAEPLIDAAVSSGRTARPGWSPRADGWTNERIRTFIAVLSECGVVADACRAVGLSPQSAYAFRNSRNGRAFDVAWRGALLRARSTLSDALMSRALNGYVEAIRRDGEVVAERHRYDNRLSMAVLTRLDQLAASLTQEDEAPRIVAYELQDYVHSLCRGPKFAAAFIEERCRMPDSAFDEDNVIRRCASVNAAEEESYLDAEEVVPDPEQEDERTLALKRLVEGLQQALERERANDPPPASPRDLRRQQARRRRRSAGSAGHEDHATSRMSDEELNRAFNRRIPKLLELAGLDGEIDPELLRTRTLETIQAAARPPAETPQPPRADDEWQPSISSTSSSNQDELPQSLPPPPVQRTDPPRPSTGWQRRRELAAEFPYRNYRVSD